MISADTSALVDYAHGKKGDDLDVIDEALSSGKLIVSPVVICELLSAPNLSKDAIKRTISLPKFEISDGYWQRAGFMRENLISKKLKARLADTLIAQSCIDHKVPLITRDVDFRHFAKHCGLKILEFKK